MIKPCTLIPVPLHKAKPSPVMVGLSPGIAHCDWSIETGLSFLCRAMCTYPRTGTTESPSSHRRLGTWLDPIATQLSWMDQTDYSIWLFESFLLFFFVSGRRARIFFLASFLLPDLSCTVSTLKGSLWSGVERVILKDPDFFKLTPCLDILQ